MATPQLSCIASSLAMAASYRSWTGAFPATSASRLRPAPSAASLETAGSSPWFRSRALGFTDWSVDLGVACRHDPGREGAHGRGRTARMTCVGASMLHGVVIGSPPTGRDGTSSRSSRPVRREPRRLRSAPSPGCRSPSVAARPCGCGQHDQRLRAARVGSSGSRTWSSLRRAGLLERNTRPGGGRYRHRSAYRREAPRPQTPRLGHKVPL